MPDVGLLARLLLRLIEPDHQVFLLDVQIALERRATIAARLDVAHARVRHRRHAEHIHVVDAERVVPACRAVQAPTDPFDVITIAEMIATRDHADRHFFAILSQRQIIRDAVAERGLRRNDRGVIERVDARVFEFDMQSTTAGEQRQRQGEQDKRECTDEECWHGVSDRGTARARQKQNRTAQATGPWARPQPRAARRNARATRQLRARRAPTWSHRKNAAR